MNWNDRFIYNEFSPSCLTWAIDIRVGNLSQILICKKGDPAGNKKYNTNKTPCCWDVTVKNKAHRVHRIIWEMFNGTIPDKMEIDHLNGNPFDNRIANLSCKTHKQNNQNMSGNSRNTSGVIGVSAVSDGRWVAAVCIGGRRISKTFSTDRNGPEAFTLACLWRREKLIEANVLGENYTERHGKGK